jgi:hypothetical protein
MIFLLSALLYSCGGSSNSVGEDNTLSTDDSETDLLQIVSPGADDAASDGTGYDATVRNILFAHGYHDEENAWDIFNWYITVNPEYNSLWTVYRTSVSRDGSIETRGEELAEYISGLDGVADNSLVVVGHSMGGLDLRYVVTMGNKHQDDADNIYYKSAKKIHKVYTISSPHGGDMFGGIIHLDDGAISLGITQMRQFNIDHPYHHFNVDNRDIPMLAFRYNCGEKKTSDGTGAIEPIGISGYKLNADELGGDVGDGTVGLVRQILFGAPFTQSIFNGRHTSNAPNPCKGVDLELETPLPVLKGILENTPYYTDVKDIIFYEHLDCEGDEKGVFSSKYKDGIVSCVEEDKCNNDEFSSLKIYPSIKANTAIKIYDSQYRSVSDDWTRIHIGETISEPFCINGFEHNTSDREADKGITVVHHYRNGINGKVSALNIFTSTDPNDPLDLVFYENDNCTGDITGVFRSDTEYNTNCKESDRCKNDESSSLLVYPSANKTADIFIYNDADGDEDHAWAHIDLTGSDFSEPYCIRGFDDPDTAHGIDVTTHGQSGICLNCQLTGTVSRVEVRP